MAEPLPASLKIPEVQRFVHRANQLRALKPAIAYWCEYRAVNQIVAKGLHNEDDDAFAFTKTLLERLETTKTEHATDDAIVDNEAAQAYVEQFAQQTFERAERTMRANKVTKVTADTFDAAATFFDVLREWGDLDPEITQKIKFAKWNAARILKASREGRDPNESNPNLEPETESGIEGLDPADPDVQQLTSPGAPQPASVQEIPDDGEPQPGSSHNQYVQDGYFPPGHTAPPTESASIPAVPPDPPSAASQIPPQPSPQIPTKLPPQFAPPPPQVPSPDVGTSPGWPTSSIAAAAAATAPAISPEVYPPTGPTAPPPPPTIPVYSAPSPAPVAAPAPLPVPTPVAAPPPASTTPFMGSHKDLNKAQKHAKFAISALNFDDVPTAVQELRNALAALGAQ